MWVGPQRIVRAATAEHKEKEAGANAGRYPYLCRAGGRGPSR
jgi:hypothetical protein